jgi:streptogramin lyase
LRLKAPLAGFIAATAALALAGCGNGNVIGGGPIPTPKPGSPHITNEFPAASNSQPLGITVGVDNFLYFTEQGQANGNPQIGKISNGGSLKEFPVTPASALPFGITSGPDGNIWFTESGNDAIVQMTIANDTMTPFPLGTPPGGAAKWQPTYIITGPSTSTMTFAAPGANAIGQITTAGAVSSFIIPTANSGVSSLVIGPDQKIWFVETNASKIGRLDPNAPAGSQFQEFPTPTANAGPTSIVVGVDGALWFTENTAIKLGRISTTGAMTEYPLADAGSATSLVVGADQNFYFADPVKNEFGRATISGTFENAMFPLPTANANPGQMVVGPSSDGRIYFPETGASKIAQLSYN